MQRILIICCFLFFSLFKIITCQFPPPNPWPNRFSASATFANLSNTDVISYTHYYDWDALIFRLDHSPTCFNFPLLSPHNDSRPCSTWMDRSRLYYVYEPDRYCCWLFKIGVLEPNWMQANATWLGLTEVRGQPVTLWSIPNNAGNIPLVYYEGVDGIPKRFTTGPFVMDWYSWNPIESNQVPNWWKRMITLPNYCEGNIKRCDCSNNPTFCNLTSSSEMNMNEGYSRGSDMGTHTMYPFLMGLNNINKKK